MVYFCSLIEEEENDEYEKRDLAYRTQIFWIYEELHDDDSDGKLDDDDSDDEFNENTLEEKVV